MQTQTLVLICSLLPCAQPDAAPRPAIPEGVVVHTVPEVDITIWFVEAAGGMTVGLKTENDLFHRRKMYLGDGTVAAEIEANNSGILMQKKRRFYQGDDIPNGSLIKVRKGYKLASELKPGDIYAILGGVTFVEPDMLVAEWKGVDDDGREVSLSLGADKAVKYTVGKEILEGTYTVAWYKQGPSYLDFDFGDRGKLQTIMQPNRQRLRIELTQLGDERPKKLTDKAVVLKRQKTMAR